MSILPDAITRGLEFEAKVAALGTGEPNIHALREAARTILHFYGKPDSTSIEVVNGREVLRTRRKGGSSSVVLENGIWRDYRTMTGDNEVLEFESFVSAAFSVADVWPSPSAQKRAFELQEEDRRAGVKDLPTNGKILLRYFLPSKKTPDGGGAPGRA